MSSTSAIPFEIDPLQPYAAVERCAWSVCVAATVLAASLLRRFDISVDRESLAAAIAVLTFLVAAHIVYGRWRPAPVLRNLSGAIAVISWSAAMAGIISLIGLRYQCPEIDDTLALLDGAIGFDGPWMVHQSAQYAVLLRVLAIAYDSSFPLLFAVATFLAISLREEKLWRLALVFAITIIFCTTVSIMVPARGAFAHFGYSAELLHRLPPGAGVYHLQKFDYFRSDPSPLLSFASLQGVVTFPSFHCCLALMTMSAAWRIRWLFPAMLVWNAIVIVSTVPIGGHYAIDVPAGALVWVAANAIATRLAQPARSDRSGVRYAQDLVRT